jgi:hypothetical protein
MLLWHFCFTIYACKCNINLVVVVVVVVVVIVVVLLLQVTSLIVSQSCVVHLWLFSVNQKY